MKALNHGNRGTIYQLTWNHRDDQLVQAELKKQNAEEEAADSAFEAALLGSQKLWGHIAGGNPLSSNT